MKSFIVFASRLGVMAMIATRRFMRVLRSNLDALGTFLIITSPFAQLLTKSTKGSVLVVSLFVWLGLTLVVMDKAIHNKQYGIPIMRKKFIKYNKGNDCVILNKEDLNEVVNYLADLQEYFEKEGML